MVDVYVAGYMSPETRIRFDSVSRFLRDNGYEVYNPFDYSPMEVRQGNRDFEMLDKARILFVVTDRVSIGTFIEIGYMSCRKRKGENVKIIVCYLGMDKYKGRSVVEWIRDYSPMTVYVDYVTDNLHDALMSVLSMLQEGQKNEGSG